MATGSLLARSLALRGEVHADTVLTVQAAVRGSLRAPRHLLTIGPGGRVEADVHARSVVVQGSVRGTVTATHLVHVAESGTVAGRIVAPRVAIEDGARVRGRVETASS